MLYQYIIGLYNGYGPRKEVASTGIANKIDHLAKNVSAAKTRIEASLVFQMSRDEVYCATVNTEYDILPLVSKHFRMRWPRYEWLIYDLKRGYALFYDSKQVRLVRLNTLDPLPKAFMAHKSGFQKMAYSPYDATAIFEDIDIRSLLAKQRGMPEIGQNVLRATA